MAKNKLKGMFWLPFKVFRVIFFAEKLDKILKKDSQSDIYKVIFFALGKLVLNRPINIPQCNLERFPKKIESQLTRYLSQTVHL